MLRLTLGSFLVILGIIGLILPIMPGWIFLIPGVVLLLGDETRAGRWVILRLHRLRRWWRNRRLKEKH